MKKRPSEEPIAFPTGLLGASPYITICDFDTVEVDGCREIVTYEDNLVRLGFRRGIVAVHGTGLVMRSFYGSRVVVSGEISGVEYVRSGDDKQTD